MRYNLVFLLLLVGCPGVVPVESDGGVLDSGSAGQGGTVAPEASDSGPADSGSDEDAGPVSVDAGVETCQGAAAGTGGMAGSAAGQGGSTAGRPGVTRPDQDLGAIENPEIWPASEGFAYACYTRDPMQDTAVCRAGYGLGDLSYQFNAEKIETARANCVAEGGIALDHTCPTNHMLQGCFEYRHSPAFSYTCYYYGDVNQGLPGLSLDAFPDLVYLNPNFTGR